MKNTKLAVGRVRDVGDERAFFISANGYDGFRTRQDTLYRSEAFTRVFVILGGPGTGKSSLLRAISDGAARDGADVEYIYCSSDPASLDGVILLKGARRVAMLDGTAPHERGASVPGAIDELVHLDGCWDTAALIKKRGEILRKREEAAEAYARARGYLCAAGGVARVLEKELDGILDEKKMAAAVTREMRTLYTTDRPFEEVRYLCACGAGGIVHLNTFRKSSDVVLVSNEHGGAHRYLNELLARLQKAGVYGYWRLPSCFDDKITQGLYLPQNKRLYLIDDGKDCARKINIKRFVLKEKEVAARKEIRRLLRLRTEMTEAAVLAFGRAAKAHFALEGIYGEAMDFGKKEALSSLLLRKVIGYLNSPIED